jgi:hypothetical protein
MQATLSCTILKNITIPNKANVDIVSQYQEYMRDKGALGHHLMSCVNNLLQLSQAQDSLHLSDVYMKLAYRHCMTYLRASYSFILSGFNCIILQKVTIQH